MSDTCHRHSQGGTLIPGPFSGLESRAGYTSAQIQERGARDVWGSARALWCGLNPCHPGLEATDHLREPSESHRVIHAQGLYAGPVKNPPKDRTEGGAVTLSAAERGAWHIHRPTDLIDFYRPAEGLTGHDICERSPTAFQCPSAKFALGRWHKYVLCQVWLVNPRTSGVDATPHYSWGARRNRQYALTWAALTNSPTTGLGRGKAVPCL